MFRGAIKAIAVAALILSGVFAAHVEAGNYTLNVGDQVRIKIYEWPDLSGDYRVGPDGMLFVSLIGQVAAEDLTPAELADRIAERLKDVARVEAPPNTTVEITEYQPFFILGDVQQPGEYVYRPGLTVLQAVSIAGGMYRIGATSPQQLRNSIVSRGELVLLGLEIDQLTARRARLHAELNSHDELEFPAALVARRKESYVNKLMTEERLLFEANATQYAEQSEVLTGLQAFYEAESEALAVQSSDARTQIASAEQQLENVETLVSRGLAPSPRQFDMEQVVAGITANQRQLETNVLRAKQSVAETKQRLLDLHWQRRNKIIAESQQTEAALEAARQKLGTTQTLILEAEMEAQMMERQDEQVAASEPEYEIIRNSGSSVDKVMVDENEPVEPGDVIRVRRVLALPSRF